MTTRQESNQEFLNHFVLSHDDLFDFLKNGLRLLRYFRDGRNCSSGSSSASWRRHSGVESSVAIIASSVMSQTVVAPAAPYQIVRVGGNSRPDTYV